MKTKFTLLALLLSLFASAQDGTLDTTFGTGGKVNYSIFSNLIDMQPDQNGKLVAIGRSTTNLPIIARFNLDGSLDTTFDNDGMKTISFGSQEFEPSSLCIYDYNSATAGYLVTSSVLGKIAKIKMDGTFDSTFGTNGFLTYDNQSGYYNYSKVTYDYTTGKIVVGIYDTLKTKIYKLTNTGLPDASFNSGNPISFYFLTSSSAISLNSINTDDNGNILVSGVIMNTPIKDIYFKKINATGAIDYSYPTSSGVVSTGRSYIRPGYVFDAFDNTSYTFGSDGYNKMLITKITSTGTSDTTFGVNGVGIFDFTGNYYNYTKSIVGHGFGTTLKIILVGRTKAESDTALANISLLRINNNGVIDTTFGTAGKVSVPISNNNYYAPLSSYVDYENGKLYVMGLSNTNTVSLYRFNLGSILSNQEFQKPQITFSPNPTSAQITFSQQINNLVVYDLLGKKVKTFTQQATTFDVAGLPKGIYLLKGITTDNTTFNEKLIIE